MVLNRPYYVSYESKLHLGSYWEQKNQNFPWCPYTIHLTKRNSKPSSIEGNKSYPLWMLLLDAFCYLPYVFLKVAPCSLHHHFRLHQLFAKMFRPVKWHKLLSIYISRYLHWNNNNNSFIHQKNLVSTITNNAFFTLLLTFLWWSLQYNNIQLQELGL